MIYSALKNFFSPNKSYQFDWLIKKEFTYFWCFSSWIEWGSKVLFFAIIESVEWIKGVRCCCSRFKLNLSSFVVDVILGMEITSLNSVEQFERQ